MCVLCVVGVSLRTDNRTTYFIDRVNVLISLIHYAFYFLTHAQLHTCFNLSKIGFRNLPKVS